MVVKKIALLIVFLFLSFLLKGQEFSKDAWHEGEVTLFSGESYTGLIKYNLENNSLQLRLADNVVKTYSSHNTESFDFLDFVSKMPRTFFSLPYQKTAGYDSPVFFELLADGNKVALLNREAVIQRSTPVYSYGLGMPVFTNVPVLVDNYYFLVKKSGKVIKFTDKKADLIDLLQDQKEKITGFIQDKKIDVTRRVDLMQVIDYYNSLQ
jgi:hypothetical protein